MCDKVNHHITQKKMMANKIVINFYRFFSDLLNGSALKLTHTHYLILGKRDKIKQF